MDKILLKKDNRNSISRDEEFPFISLKCVGIADGVANVWFQLLSLDDNIHRDYRTIRNLLYEIRYRTIPLLITT